MVSLLEFKDLILSVTHTAPFLVCWGIFVCVTSFERWIPCCCLFQALRSYCHHSLELTGNKVEEEEDRTSVTWVPGQNWCWLRGDVAQYQSYSF